MCGIIAIATGIGFYLFPSISDDLGYIIHLDDWVKGKSDWWRCVYDSAVWRYWNNNGRIANVVMIILAKAPKIIPILVSTLSVWAILWYGCKIGRFANRTMLTALWITGFTCLYPWIDQMYLIDFQINYLWTTALSLFILKRWLTDAGNSTVTIICCFIIGFWHEAFAGGLLFTIICLMILYPSFRSKRNLLCVISFLPGIAYLYYPRIGETPMAFFSTRSIMVYAFMLPLIIMAILWLITLSKERIRKICFRPDIVALSLLAVSGCMLMAIIKVGPRAGSLGIVASLIGSCALLSHMPLTKRHRIAGIILSVLLYVFTSIHLLAVDIQCYKAGQYTDYVLNEYSAAPDKTIFTDMTLREQAPLICLQKPYYGWFSHFSTTSVFRGFYGIDHKPLRVVPKALETYSSDKSRKIEGSADLEDFGGWLLGPAPDTDGNPCIMVLDIATSAGLRTAREYYVLPMSESGELKGKAWYYPEHTLISQLGDEKIVLANVAD